MTIPTKWDMASLSRFASLYAVLALYGLAYGYFYSDQLTPLIHDDLTAYDPSKSSVYTLIAFLTPLAILPLGTKLRAPGQFIAAALAVFLFIPIPIVFAAMVGEPEFWSVYALLWLGFLAVCTLSSLSVKLPLPAVSELQFNKAVFALSVLLGIGLLYVLATNRFSIVGLDRAHEERGNVTVSGLQGYLLVGYATSYGGLMAGMALMYRKYWALPFVFAGYVVCYGTLEVRNDAVMPLWILYIYFAHKWYFRDSVIKLLTTLMAPFLLGMFTIALIGEVDRTSLVYDAFTLANYRLYSIPAIGFNAYFNFFATHPFTHWSHITIIGDFVSNPYGQPLGAVMDDAYHQGSYNASFLETDGLAAAGVGVLPFISMLFGMVMLGVNSCMRGLNITLLVVVTAGSSIALTETGIGPGLVTNGVAFLSVFMLFVPRDASWNMRQLSRIPLDTGAAEGAK
jgi:hypothetical protein